MIIFSFGINISCYKKECTLSMVFLTETREKTNSSDFVKKSSAQLTQKQVTKYEAA